MMNRKRGIVFSLFAIVLLSVTVWVSGKGVVSPTVKIGNDVIEFQNDPAMIDEKMYVSIRELGENMGIPILWDGNKQEVHMDVQHKKVITSKKTQYKEEGVIPDEETALAVGKLILEKYAGRQLEYETELHCYYLRAEFIEAENAWLVVQNFKFTNPNAGGGIDWADYANVKLNKNTGEVMYINTYSDYSD